MSNCRQSHCKSHKRSMEMQKGFIGYLNSNRYKIQSKTAGKRQQRKKKHVGGEQTNKTQQTETRVRGWWWRCAPALLCLAPAPSALSLSLSFQGCLTRTLNKNSTTGRPGPSSSRSQSRNTGGCDTVCAHVLIASSCNRARGQLAEKTRSS